MTSRKGSVFERFGKLPEAGYQTIYAVHITNGWVKIGCTGNLKARFITLGSQIHCKHGESIASVHYGEHIEGHRHHQYAEHTLIKRMHQIASPVKGHIEYFSGVDFDAAKGLVDEISKSAWRKSKAA